MLDEHCPWISREPFSRFWPATLRCGWATIELTHSFKDKDIESMRSRADINQAEMS